MDALKYNKEADRRSWRHMQVFFDELFGQGQLSLPNAPSPLPVRREKKVAWITLHYQLTPTLLRDFDLYR